MPPLLKRQVVPQARDVAAEFKSGFRRSARGNLWREWKGSRVIIIDRVDDFGWMIVDGDGGKRFSKGGFDREDDAIEAARLEFGPR